MELSIIIVNYNTADLTLNCVNSIFENTHDVDFEVIVVDNKSVDNSKETILDSSNPVVWVQMSENGGTSRGYNAGVKAAQGKYVLILNSDTILKDNSIGNSLIYHKHKEKSFKVGMTACQVRGFDNEIQFTSNTTFPSIKKYLFYTPFLYKLGIRPPKNMGLDERLELHKNEHEASWIGIAFGIINKSIFTDENVWFDEDIFMYSDEVDWCYRLHKKGYKHFFNADESIYHVNSGSSVSSDWRYGQIYLSELFYFYKLHGSFLFKLMVYSIKSSLKRASEKDCRIERDVIKRYSNKITEDYLVKPNSGKTYLKYEIND